MKLSPQAKARLALLSTFLVAIVLSIMPGPTWAESFRPDWVGLVLIYWCIAVPERVGVGTGFVLGLIMDVLYGALLGSNALVKSLLVFLAELRKRLRTSRRSWRPSLTALAYWWPRTARLQTRRPRACRCTMPLRNIAATSVEPP